MNVFLDTNIILEVYFKRKNFLAAQCILESAEKKEHKYFISLGAFYTITYFLEDEIKSRGIHRPQSIELLREILLNLLSLVTVTSIDNDRLAAGIEDERFKDLEDSYQYQTAKVRACDFLVTLNTKDFKTESDHIPTIISPQEFIAHLNA